jgi:hypothetical protein
VCDGPRRVLQAGSLDATVTECPACHQPVAVPVGGERGPCPGCGAAVEPLLPVLSEPREGLGLQVDLRCTLSGLEDLGERPAKPRLPVLQAAWHETKKRLATPHATADEFRAVWLAATLGRIYGATGDVVRERAVLEAALERLAVPAYRAMILARLCRAAAVGGHLDLAERWLEQAQPSELVEVDADVLAARAFVELRRGRLSGVLALLGERDEGSSLAGLALPFGDLVRVEALERAGRRWPAYDLYRRAVRAHGALVLQGLVMHYGLARRTRRMVVAVGALVILAILVLLATAYLLVAAR